MVNVVSHLTIYRPRALTTPWPPPQRGGELVGRLRSLSRRGIVGMAPLLFKEGGGWFGTLETNRVKR
jgi:hypothetical protein